MENYNSKTFIEREQDYINKAIDKIENCNDFYMMLKDIKNHRESLTRLILYRTVTESGKDKWKKYLDRLFANEDKYIECMMNLIKNK